MRFDWNDLKFFLELIRTGNPTDAGRRLKADHTTVRRRIDSLETDLRAQLFSSRGPNYELTAEGDRLLKYSEAIETLAFRVQGEMGNNDVAVSGTVRIGTLDGFGAFYLAPRLGQLREMYPGLQIQLAVLPRVVNLSNREADVAITLSPPPGQQKQILRKLTGYTLRIYGSEDYLRSHAPIASVSDLTKHTFIGYVPDLFYAPELDFMSDLPASVKTPLELTSIVAQIKAAAAGAGLCVLPNFMAASRPELRAVLVDSFKLERELWIVTHPELMNLARVRAVIDFISEQVRQDKALLLGDPEPVADEARH